MDRRFQHVMRQEKDKTENVVNDYFGTAEISVVPFLLGAIGMFCVCNILRDNVFKSFFSVTIFFCNFAI